MDLQQQLEKTIAILEEKGWNPTYLQHPVSKTHCLLGAYNVACSEYGHSYWIDGFGYDKASPVYQPFVRALEFTSIKEAVDWNRAQISAAPVLQRLRRAVAQLSADGEPWEEFERSSNIEEGMRGND
jgi:hypothetical protein